MIFGKKLALVAAYQRLGRTIRQAEFVNPLPRAPRRYTPHQGKREMERRVRQLRRGIIQ